MPVTHPVYVSVAVQAVRAMERMFPGASAQAVARMIAAMSSRVAAECVDDEQYACGMATAVHQAHTALSMTADTSTLAWAEAVGYLIWALHGRPATYRDVGLITALKADMHQGAPPTPPLVAIPPPPGPCTRLPQGAASPLRCLRRVEHRGARYSGVYAFA